MKNNLKPIQLLNKFSESAKSSQLMITHNSVTWELAIVKGKLQYATHSLQSGETIQHYLLRLGYGDAAKAKPAITRNLSDNRSFVRQVVNSLVTQGHLNAIQKTILLRELTQDALESLLWLTTEEYSWREKKLTYSTKETPLELPPLINSLQGKLQQWQKLSPLITSPHQRPQCIDPSLLGKPLPSGTISSNVLKQLVKLMRGLSIRQLALFVKQDDLKIAQMLYPYVKHNILQLQAPKSSLEKLPHIPALQLQHSNEIKPTIINKVAPASTISSKQSTQKKHKIVCIDDSPTMLELMETYLGKEEYELLTVENPMQSLPKLFANKPDLILMDISMPGINGNRLSQILKRSS
ncbi:MAG: response regulator, partial [Cyanobacteria bacterium P01_G01_bin.49]